MDIKDYLVDNSDEKAEQMFGIEYGDLTSDQQMLITDLLLDDYNNRLNEDDGRVEDVEINY